MGVASSTSGFYRDEPYVLFHHFIGLTCLFTFFRLKWYVTFPICAGLILLALYLIFYQSAPGYPAALFADIKDNITLMSMGME